MLHSIIKLTKIFILLGRRVRPERVKIFLCTFHKLKYWTHHASEKVPDAKTNLLYKMEVLDLMRNVMYLSMKHGEEEKNFIKQAQTTMEKVFVEYNIPQMRAYFDNHYASLYGLIQSPFP